MTRKPIPLDVPATIAEEIRKTPRGKVTVVDFVDFECPFCRMTHAELGPLLAERKDQVRVARKHVPLRMHAHAMDAARAACCGEKLGKGDEMAEALFTTEPSALTPEGCADLAAKHGLDVARFGECMKDPETDARIHADGEAFRAAHGHGLPTLYIDGTKLEGAQERTVLTRALDAAIRAL
jgi:predicted DsbA family dithiol-disulfide isomerase